MPDLRIVSILYLRPKGFKKMDCLGLIAVLSLIGFWIDETESWRQISCIPVHMRMQLPSPIDILRRLFRLFWHIWAISFHPLIRLNFGPKTAREPFKPKRIRIHLYVVILVRSIMHRIDCGYTFQLNVKLQICHRCFGALICNKIRSPDSMWCNGGRINSMVSLFPKFRDFSLSTQRPTLKSVGLNAMDFKKGQKRFDGKFRVMANGLTGQ